MLALSLSAQEVKDTVEIDPIKYQLVYYEDTLEVTKEVLEVYDRQEKEFNTMVTFTAVVMTLILAVNILASKE